VRYDWLNIIIKVAAPRCKQRLVNSSPGWSLHLFTSSQPVNKISSSCFIIGEEWKEQRRFALKHLRDFGFGKGSMEEIIREEFTQLSDKLSTCNGKEIDSDQLFNLSVINVLWGMVAGKRYNYSKISLRLLQETQRKHKNIQTKTT
jgi:hypothetical protein